MLPVKAVVSWQIVLLPYLEKNDVYHGNPIRSSRPFGSPNPLPYIDITVCPSDNSIAGKSGPWTSYVCNTGRLDKLRTYNNIPNTVCVADYSVSDPGNRPTTESFKTKYSAIAPVWDCNAF